MELGLRVVRGPDWKWGQQDGGEGHVGTVVEIGHYNSSNIPHKTVVVQWDSGARSNYRVGYQKTYDLRVFDNAPVGAYHPRIQCDGCDSEGIIGMRWQCSTCIDFDLCTPCYMKGAHDLNHTFIRIDTIYHLGLEMPKRSLNNAVRIQARGIFKGAKVVRGYDWEWDNQDGGEGVIGEVIDIRGWDKASARSVASVRWGRSTNVYRIGHKGKVDLKCVVDAPGDYYYRDHLPILGQNFVVSGPPESHVGATANARPQPSPASHQQQILSIPSSSSSSSPSTAVAAAVTTTSAGATVKCYPLFDIGDKVKVIAANVEELKMLQRGHGGWNPRMAQYINKVGVVHRITDSRDIRVQFDNSRTRWTFNPQALEKFSSYSIGDLVKALDDEEQIRKLQSNHGEYIPDMRCILGATGRVVKVYSDGDLRVNFSGKTWTLNPLCLINLSEMKRPEQLKEKKPEALTWKEWMDELRMLDGSFRDIYLTDKKVFEGKDSSDNNTANTSSSSIDPSSANKSSASAESSSNLLNGPPTSFVSSFRAEISTDVKCLICDENFANIQFFPCAHQVCCSDCSDCIVRMKKCISCKQIIHKLLYIDSTNGQIFAIVEHGASASSSNSSYGQSSSSALNNHISKDRLFKEDNEVSLADPLQRLKYLESRIIEIEEANTCGICLEKAKNVIFLCGHGACADCSSTLITCHMCRKTITKKINIY